MYISCARRSDAPDRLALPEKSLFLEMPYCKIWMVLAELIPQFDKFISFDRTRAQVSLPVFSTHFLQHLVLEIGFNTLGYYIHSAQFTF
jgi:hypothetical protein